MNANIFVECELPNTLSEEETIEYFKQYKNGNLIARKILVEHNIRLVINQVLTKFKNSGHELEDLVDVGTIGLINAVNTFDLDKNTKFQTYACKCIFNEIAIYLKRNNKHINLKSLNEIIMEEDNGKEISIIDSIVDEKVDVSNECVRKIINLEILQEVENLVGRNKEIIKLYYGFYNNRCYTQKEISEMFGITRQNVSMIITKELKKISKRLERKNIVDNTDVDIRLLSRN